jgi:hypothetical protein
MVVVVVVLKGGGGVGEEVVDAASEGEESRERLPVATTRKKGWRRSCSELRGKVTLMIRMQLRCVIKGGRTT